MPRRFNLLQILKTRLCRAGLTLALLAPLTAQAQTTPERIPSHCLSLARAAPQEARIIPAAWTDPVRAEAVRISYVDHSMFLLQTPGGLNMMTDYNGFHGNSGLIPDVVTMNHAHSSHWAPAPDPAIPHVLQGWADAQGPAQHALDLGEVLASERVGTEFWKLLLACIVALAVAEAFLARCLGGRYQPVGGDFQGSSITVPMGAEQIPGLYEALLSSGIVVAEEPL